MKKLRVGVVRFLGSNCDQDCADALSSLGFEVVWLWHDQSDLPSNLDAIVLPGGFSYGDFLRSGALAAHSRVMGAVRAYVVGGGHVLGICNGFQILAEMQLLPGCLLPNIGGRFVCKKSNLRLAAGTSRLHEGLRKTGKSVWGIPVAHGDGRYFVDEPEALLARGEVLFLYEDNPNGSVADIAGVLSPSGRVLGMMPHPERALNLLVGGSIDGRSILETFFLGGGPS